MIQNKKVIGITGSISTGKSQVTNYLLNKGEFVIDSDKIALEIINEKEVISDIKNFFGEELYKKGNLDREKLGNLIFSNKENKKILDDITHPIIFKKIKEKLESSNNRINFIDLPLLIENKINNKLYGLQIDEIWLVYASENVQIKRLMNRDNIDREYAKVKINSQMSIDDKVKYADIVLCNSGSLLQLEKDIEKNLKRIKND